MQSDAIAGSMETRLEKWQCLLILIHSFSRMRSGQVLLTPLTGFCNVCLLYNCRNRFLLWVCPEWKHSFNVWMFFLLLHCTLSSGSRCGPQEVKEQSTDEMAESRENADAASARKIDNIDRSAAPTGRLLKWRTAVCVRFLLTACRTAETRGHRLTRIDAHACQSIHLSIWLAVLTFTLCLCIILRLA